MPDDFTNPLRDRLRAGQPSYMMGVRFSRSPDIAGIAKASGFHGLMVDLEHSTISLDTAGHICAAAGSAGLTPIVRIPLDRIGVCGPLLDTGAMGVVGSMIETAADAQRVVNACRFPPLGGRSQTGTAPQLGFRRMPPAEASRALEASTVAILLIETPEAIANIDEIAAVEGVDILWIGLNDLTGSLGIHGQYEHAKVSDAFDRVLAAGRKHGKLVAVGGIARKNDFSIFHRFVERGAVPLYLIGVDSEMLQSTAEQRVADVTASASAAKKPG